MPRRLPLPEPGVHSYFQALALRELGNEEAGREVLSSLARFADEKRKAVAKIDYFATSLPNLLLFDDDLEERNRIESLFLSALANDGLGNRDKAHRTVAAGDGSGSEPCFCRSCTGLDCNTKEHWR